MSNRPHNLPAEPAGIAGQHPDFPGLKIHGMTSAQLAGLDPNGTRPPGVPKPVFHQLQASREFKEAQTRAAREAGRRGGGPPPRGFESSSTTRKASATAPTPSSSSSSSSSSTSSSSSSRKPRQVSKKTRMQALAVARNSHTAAAGPVAASTAASTAAPTAPASPTAAAAAPAMSVEQCIQAAAAARDDQRLGDAVRWWRQAVAADPSHLMAWFNLAWTLVQDQKPRYAILALDSGFGVLAGWSKQTRTPPVTGGTTTTTSAPPRPPPGLDVPDDVVHTLVTGFTERACVLAQQCMDGRNDVSKEISLLAKVCAVGEHRPDWVEAARRALANFTMGDACRRGNRNAESARYLRAADAAAQELPGKPRDFCALTMLPDVLINGAAPALGDLDARDPRVADAARTRLLAAAREAVDVAREARLAVVERRDGGFFSTVIATLAKTLWNWLQLDIRCWGELPADDETSKKRVWRRTMGRKIKCVAEEGMLAARRGLPERPEIEKQTMLVLGPLLKSLEENPSLRRILAGPSS